MSIDLNPQPPSYDLPEYSPTGETPDYTPEPGPHEERIQINRRFVREDSGVFVTQNKSITLALTNQPLDCKEPTYGKGATIQGMVSLAKTEGITSVILKFQGEMEFALASLVVNGSTGIPVLDDHIVLYRKPGTSQQDSKRNGFGKKAVPSLYNSLIPPLSSAEKCPASITFNIRIPPFYTHEGINRPLPPTYSSRFGDGIPGLSVDCHYLIQIAVVRKGSLIDKRSTLCVPINYLPRSRPARPPLPQSLTFLATLKSAPEEWKLFDTEMKTRQDCPPGPTISAGLLLPQSQVYAIGQPIPFHLQLTSASSSALAPFTAINNFSDSPSVKHPSQNLVNPRNTLAATSGLIGRRGMSVTEDQTVKAQVNLSTKSFFQNNVLPRIHLSVQRHVTVEVMGQWVQFKECLSRAVLHSCPVNTLEESGKYGGSANIAWEGQLEILERHKCSSFTGPGIRVRDFIWLSVKPPNPEQSSLQGIHFLVPVKLTTDAYSEELIRGMELAQEPPAISIPS